MVKVHIQVVRFLNWFFDTLLAACGATKVKHEALNTLKATFKTHDALWKNLGRATRRDREHSGRGALLEGED